MDDICADLYEKLRELQWLLQRQHMIEMEEYGPCADTTRGQGRVLALLKIQSEISTKDLAYLLGIRQQSLNEVLNKLEKGGYVERKPSEDDKRILLVHLTEKGKCLEQPETDYENIFNCLSPEELVIFGGYLDRLIEALEKKLNITPDTMQTWIKNRTRMRESYSDFFMRSCGMRGPGFPFRKKDISESFEEFPNAPGFSPFERKNKE